MPPTSDLLPDEPDWSQHPVVAALLKDLGWFRRRYDHALEALDMLRRFNAKMRDHRNPAWQGALEHAEIENRFYREEVRPAYEALLAAVVQDRHRRGTPA